MRGRRSRIGRSVVRLATSASLLLVFAGSASAERLPIKAYTVENGLAHNRVKRIVQDSHAFLWFCTAAGLSRFDGYQFTNYTPENGLPSLSINDLVEGQDGTYWIATNSDGVIRFDLRESVPSTPELSRLFTVYPISNEPVTNRVNVLYRDPDGTLWAGSDGGLFRMNAAAGERTFEPVVLGIPARPELQVQIWALLEDQARNLWIGTKFGLLRRGRDGSMTHYTVRPSTEDDRVAALVLDKDGTLWMGHRAGLFHFDPRVESPSGSGATKSRSLPADTRRYTTADGLEHEAVMSLHQSSDGHLWLRTFGRGVTEFDGQRFHTYTVGDRVGDIIGALSEDREGNLWLGTTALGALKIMRDGWTTYGEGDGLGQSVASMFETAAGELYVNSSAWHVSRFDGRRFTTVRPPLPSEISDVSWRDVNGGVIQDHVGDWWIATRVGLYRFARVARFEDLGRAAPAAVYTVRDGLASDDVTRLFEDGHGDIWISSWLPARDPLVRWIRTTGRFQRYSATDGLRPFTSIVSFLEDAAGDLWVGLREGGLFRYRNGRFSEVGKDLNLGSNSVNSLYLDPAGRLWAAAGRGGLWRIDHPEADQPMAVAYTMRDGLTSGVVHVTGDLQGRIYASHMRGIDRLDPSTLEIKHYSTMDVLPGSEFKAALRDQRGALWFCTTTGLARLVPIEPSRTAPPPILIGALRVSGVTHPVSPLGETAIAALRLGPAQNNIQVDFFGLGFRAGETLRYQYKLEGSTSDWSAPRVQRSVDFASLAPGRYRFQVRAITTDGTVSASPAFVGFEILPPIWRRWWFLTAVASTLIAGIVAVARYRYERVKALRESENRFRTLAETASDAIVTIDETGRIVLVNRAAEKVFGYTRHEMIGRELGMLMPAHPRLEHAFAHYLQTGERTSSWEALAVVGIREDGSEIPLEISFGEFTQGDRHFFTGIIRDVTERRRAEEALRRSREERLIELERVRKRIATDLHDDVGSSLTRISLLSEVVRRQVDGVNPSVAESLSSIAGLSRELVDSMSDIVWAINPMKDHLSDLSQRMRHFVSDLCTARQIEFRFRTPPLDIDIPVGANIRREVFLLFKEAVNNMVRHSGCSEADLEFGVTAEGLVLHVSDNGRGFVEDAASAGHGLRSMRERTAALGGDMQMESRPGVGTILTFTIPLTDRGQVDATPPDAVVPA
jgi:PAS domain S-box-containing protein